MRYAQFVEYFSTAPPIYTVIEILCIPDYTVKLCQVRSLYSNIPYS